MKNTSSLFFGLVFLVTCFPSTVSAQSGPEVKELAPVIDSIYGAFAKKYHAPGISYAVIHNGEIISMKALGVTDVPNQIPATPKSVFRIASMSKSFAGVAILQLRDVGKLKLDDPVSQYIPKLKNQKMLTTDAPELSIRHLLTHIGGLPEDNPWGDRQLGISDAELDSLIGNGFSFSNAPGIEYEYSNTAFALLGYIIGKVSGQPYHTFINENILKPLEMHNTYWEYTEVPDSVFAKGYRWFNDEWVAQPVLGHGGYGIMGGLMTSMEDFVKYVQFFQDAWPARDDEDNGPLKRSSLREMQQPWTFNALQSGGDCAKVLGYGYGLRWSKDCKGVEAIGHTGGLPGYGSNWMIVPKYGLGVVAFANVTYANTSGTNYAVIDEIIRLADLQPRGIPASGILIERQKQLTAVLPDWGDAENTGIFAENFFDDFYIDVLRAESQEIFKKAGRILKTHDISPLNNLRGTYLLECDNADIEVFFTLSPERLPLIQDYSIRLIEKE